MTRRHDDVHAVEALRECRRAFGDEQGQNAEHDPPDHAH
jgi:hypothetical protein